MFGQVVGDVADQALNIGVAQQGGGFSDQNGAHAEGFDDQAHGPGLRTQRLPGRIHVGRRLDAELPFAVIAQSTRLEDAGAPEPIDFAA